MPEPLIVPGVLAIEPGLWDCQGPAPLLRGPLAGRAQMPEISDWKQEIWLLSRDAASRYGVALPEQRLDLSRHPQVRALLAEATLIQVSDPVALRAAAAGELLVFLAYHRGAGGGGLDLHEAGAVRGFSAEDFELNEVASGRPPEEEEEDSPPVEKLYDRILRALSGGRLSLLHVDLAQLAAKLPASELDSYEQELTEIATLAADRHELARSILATVDSATGDTLLLPGGYAARRQRLPAFTLRSQDTLRVNGPPIEVPAEEIWVVEDVHAFTPPARKQRRERHLAALASARPAGRAPWVLVAAGVVLLVLGLLAAALS